MAAAATAAAEQDTGKFRTNTKDQYYTKPAVAKHCIEALLRTLPAAATSYRWVEPAAGAGAFFGAVPTVATADAIGLDIEPKGPGILKGNFLDWVPPAGGRPLLFFGNPPFGRQSATAKAFIKRAAELGEVIAFILPRSFVKPSMSRAFPPAFHCLLSEALEPRAFEVNGDEYDVPCVFQVWQKKGTPRATAVAVEPVGFSYVKPGEAYHIAFKRAGGNAGKCYPAAAPGAYSAQSHNFIRLEDCFVPHVTSILAAMNAHVFPTNTTGPRSLSKSEANEVLVSILSGVESDVQM